MSKFSIVDNNKLLSILSEVWQLSGYIESLDLDVEKSGQIGYTIDYSKWITGLQQRNTKLRKKLEKYELYY